MSTGPLRVRWLGRVRYRDALAVQHGLFRRSGEDYLLLVEHPSVYTLGVRASLDNVLEDPESVGAELVRADRGGDVTFHGPGQLVGYPVLDVALGPNAIPDYVGRVEELVIGVLADLGIRAGRLTGYPGVWVDHDGGNPRKICAIGVRVSRGRSMHGFALNVDPDLSMFSHIVPCGIPDRPVTSIAAEGVTTTMADVVDLVVARAGSLFPAGLDGRGTERQDATAPAPANLVLANPGPSNPGPADPGPAALRPIERRLASAGVDTSRAVALREHKPDWMRVEARMGEEYLGLRRTMRTLDLVTVCEEAGCPNIYECWADGTATFMINGERCTRACGFCLVDTRHPMPLDPGEPARVAEAVANMGLKHAVVTTVARDDLDDGGAAAFAATIREIRRRCPGTTVEVLISDCKGDERSLGMIFDAAPDVLNHNLETVLRLQRAVRPSASYARSLAVLSRARSAGLLVKSGIILGMGEEEGEVLGALADLAAMGVQVVTLGQYLRPSATHLPVARYWRPEEFAELGRAARAMGFLHVEASPLTRSSYHARQAVEVTRAVAATA